MIQNSKNASFIYLVLELGGGGWLEAFHRDQPHTLWKQLCLFHSGGRGCAQSTVAVFYLPGDASPDSLGLEADLNSNQFLLSPSPYKNLGH